MTQVKGCALEDLCSSSLSIAICAPAHRRGRKVAEGELPGRENAPTSTGKLGDPPSIERRGDRRGVEKIPDRQGYSPARMGVVHGHLLTDVHLETGDFKTYPDGEREDARGGEGGIDD